jgi:hypothetical protein
MTFVTSHHTASLELATIERLHYLAAAIETGDKHQRQHQLGVSLVVPAYYCMYASFNANKPSLFFDHGTALPSATNMTCVCGWEMVWAQAKDE